MKQIITHNTVCNPAGAIRVGFLCWVFSEARRRDAHVVEKPTFEPAASYGASQVQDTAGFESSPRFAEYLRNSVLHVAGYTSGL